MLKLKFLYLVQNKCLGNEPLFIVFRASVETYKSLEFQVSWISHKNTDQAKLSVFMHSHVQERWGGRINASKPVNKHGKYST